jgi:N-acetylmuramoyl-L-alanine amidase
MKVCISAGHSSKCRGMSSEWLDEVDEARRVTTQVGTNLEEAGVDVVTYWDDVSDDQQENLKRICDFHNAQGAHDLDVSVHFNASNGQGHGTEVFYTSSTGHEYADAICDAICEASGLTNRGAKNDDDIGGLYFLSHTNEVAVLIEVCFGDNESDCVTYYDEFDNICEAIDRAICEVGDHDNGVIKPPDPEQPDDDVLFRASGTCSTFGGPTDTGVSPSEGLAFFYEVEDAPWLFLQDQPPGTTGLARRMDPAVFFIACRWDYDVTSKEMLATSGQMALVTNKKTGVSRLAHPADWGPHEAETGRAADLSPALAESLGVRTDDEVAVIYPYLP